MTSQARPAAICSWLSVLCIESSRSCRLVAGMHLTSFELGKGVGSLRTVFCVLVSNIDWLWRERCCSLSAAFAVNGRHRTSAFTASGNASSIVTTRKQKKEDRLHSKRSHVKIVMAKLVRQNAAQSMYVVSLNCWRCIV